MGLTGWLSRLAVVVWVLWLGLLGLLAAMVRGRVGHPHYLPVTALLSALAVAWVLLAGGTLRRLILGPGRVHALTCLLLGTVPVAVLTGHILFGLRGGYGRSYEVSYPMILLVPLGESVMDLEARVRYPLRTPGKKVVMISGPLDAASARAQVAAMDRHVLALEAKLGRTMPGQVHWVRGPLLGMEGRAIYALCLGSKPGEHSVDADGLAMLDRHEVAHCVIGLMSPTDRVPPALLSEGWAESNGGLSEAELSARAADLRENGGSLSLRELTGPEWYGRHQWPVYCQALRWSTTCSRRTARIGSSGSTRTDAPPRSPPTADASSERTSTKSTPTSRPPSTVLSAPAGSSARGSPGSEPVPRSIPPRGWRSLTSTSPRRRACSLPTSTSG